MLKYTTLKESDRLKLSKVKNSKTGKTSYSLLYKDYHFRNWASVQQYIDTTELLAPLGDYHLIALGREWRFDSFKKASRKYVWATLLV